MNGWWIALTSQGFLALCVAFDGWWLNGSHHFEYGDSNGTHP